MVQEIRDISLVKSRDSEFYDEWQGFIQTCSLKKS